MLPQGASILIPQRLCCSRLMSSVQNTVPLVPSHPQQGSSHVGVIKRALVQVYPLDLNRDPIILSTSRLTIGRDNNNDLVISDQSVSRQHAELRLTDQGAVLLDLDSTNGVSVNGSRTDAQLLVNGDHLQIGTFLFRYLATADELEPLYLATVYTMMTRDGLTRVFNRRYFSETLRREMSRCQRYVRPISLVMINLDQLAAVNQRYGAMIGDQVLKQLARRLENILRDDDVLARISEDNFALLMVEAGLEDAAEIAERCRLAVGSEPVVTSVGPIKVTISLGIAVRPSRGNAQSAPSQSQQAREAHEVRSRSSGCAEETSGQAPPRERWGAGDELLREANERLREAKRAGRNRTVC